MTNKLWISLTAALITTALGTTVSNQGFQTKALATELGEKASLEAHLSEPISEKTNSPNNQDTALLNSRDSQTDPDLDTQNNQIATVYGYQLENTSAATLYIRSLPVITFLESQAQDDPLGRAVQVANRINELQDKNFDASKIIVSWNADSQSYSIKAGNEELVRLDQNTILADTTENLTHDALHATNRLRRLLGNAAPLTEIAGKPKPKPPAIQAQQQQVLRQIKGVASWYGPGFHGRRSANGERFNQNAMTAAHRTLPFGTKVRVTNLNNGRSVVVRINDRGPYIGKRVIDLSAGAAKVIGMTNSGTARVSLEILSN